MKKALLGLIMLIIPVISLGQNVVIFQFYNEKGTDIPGASIGVLKSVVQYIKYLPGITIEESSFNVKNRDIKEIIKTFPGYENYIIGSYDKNNEIFNYSITIYDKTGVELKKFKTSSEDLFDVADNITKEISSFYSSKSVGFATLNIFSKLPEDKRFTIILNDQVLYSTKDKKDLTIKVISKIPYTILARDDETKEVIFNKTITLLDNESLNLEVKLPELTNTQPTKNSLSEETTKQEKDKLTKQISKTELILNIEKVIRDREILNEIVRTPLKEDLKLIEKETKEKIFKKHKIPIFLTIISTVANIIPGVGSAIIGDDSGTMISLILPWSTALITTILPEGGLKTTFGVITIIGYAYNLVRPTIYTVYWNNTLSEFLLTQNFSISTEFNKISLNIRF